MRIAMLAPLYESVPPRRYGGTERVVSYLTEELIRRGHAVTLFAAGGSRTAAELVEVCPAPLNAAPRLTDPVAFHFLQLGIVMRRASEFDLIHSHCDFRALPFTPYAPVPIVSTSHNRLDAPECRELSRAFPDALLTAISCSHQRQLPGANWAGVCYDGVPVPEFPFSSRAGRYLAFVGRFSPEKGPVEAIEVAERTGIPLRIVAKINEWERDYFEAEIRPRLRPPLVEYVGELAEEEKRYFLRDALALLFPISWPEPFGMVMIEAMATGTPVLAFPTGSAPEIVVDGVSGFLCRDVGHMAAQVREIEAIDRASCRDYVDRRFSAVAMTNAYESVYHRVVQTGRTYGPSPLVPLAAR